MRVFRTACIAMAFFAAVGLENHSFAGEKVGKSTDKPKAQRHTASARVVASAGFIQAVQEGQDFEVPEGAMAVDIKYDFADPKTGYTSNKLGSSQIYSISQKRYITEAKNNPKLVLPPGKYRFVVGGLPGAVGTLGYTLEYGKDGQTTDKEGKKPEPAADRIIDVVQWLPTREEFKTPATYYIQGAKVTGIIDHVFNAFKRDQHFYAEPQRSKGAFTGTINGMVIEGVWKIENLPYKVIITNPDGKTYDRVDSSNITTTARTVLQAGGTLTITEKGSGTSTWKWGPAAPDPNKEGSHKWDFSVPGKDFPQPFQGTWKERKPH